MDSNPLLVNALDLDRWADTQESKGVFPELMRRLLAQTPGVTNIDIRAREGTAAPGWDGTATSDGSSFLPKGELRFEFGTNQQPKSKANEDYNKRADEIVGKSDEIFVFATPRNWAGAAEWAKERSSENKFASVEAFDAHRLEGWLQSVPAVHLWLSELLGKPVSGAQTLTSWWEQLRRNCKIEVPPEFHTAGRDNESERLMHLLGGRGTVPTVQAAWRDDALAFCHAVILYENKNMLEKTLLVHDVDSWNRVTSQLDPVLLIPMFDDPDIGLAQSRGHNVVQIVDESSYILDRDNGIRLPKISREVAARVLRRGEFASLDIDKMVALARRSMSAFYRAISRDPKIRRPEWSMDAESAKVLVPLMLVGAWEFEHVEDCRAIEELVGVSNEEINALLERLSAKYQSNAPFVRSGGRWSSVDPLGAADLMFHKVSNQHVSGWQNLVESIVLSNMRRVRARRVHASAELDTQNIRAHSATLERHVMRGLPLVSAWAERNGMSAHRLFSTMNRLINGLINAALESEGFIGLNDLSWAFGYFAEASPDLFLDRMAELVQAAEVQSVQPEVVLCDDENGLFVTDVTNAMDCLTWSRRYYARSIYLIAAIGSTMCDDRLCSTLSFDLSKTLGVRSTFGNGDIDDKSAIVHTLLSKYPRIGWNSLTSIMCPNMFNIVPRRPIYRDWAVENCVSDKCVAIYLEKIIDVAVLTAESDVSRWEILLNAVAKYGCHKLQKVVKELQQRVQPSTLSKSEAVKLGNILHGYIGMCDSRTCVEDCARQLLDVELEGLIASLESAHDLVKFSCLFICDDPLVAGRSRHSFDDQSISVKARQLEALRHIWQNDVDDLKLLAETIVDRNCIGQAMAHFQEDLDPLVLGWIDGSAARVREVARKYVLEKASSCGVSWVRSVLKSDQLQGARKAYFVASLPVGKEWHALLDEIDCSLLHPYWESFDLFEIQDLSSDDASELVPELMSLGYVDKAIVLSSCKVPRGGSGNAHAIIDVLLSFFESYIFLPGDPVFSLAKELIEWVDSLMLDQPDVILVEFLYFASGDNDLSLRTLYKYFSLEPQRFVSLVCGSYVPEGCPEWLSAEKIHDARLAIISRWNRLPGLSDDNVLDGNFLRNWFERCFELLSQVHCFDYGIQQLGRVLASSPEGSDGMWPVEDVRDIIEKYGCDALKKGLVTGHISLYGPTVKGTYEGGDSERELMHEYRAYAQQMNVHWPKTVTVLTSLADVYQRIAYTCDRDAEERADQG